MKYLRVLGLESSCDDTAAAIVDSVPTILSNIVISQNTEHVEYLGVVPEIAARSHLINIEGAVDQCLAEADLDFSDIDAIAATCGPGLIGGVIISSMYGKALASALGKPFIAINHLEGHALTAMLTNKVAFPYLVLLASGGHCQFIAVKSLGNYQILGSTIDDAVGEAFDKVAKMMNLGFPGGPIIETLAASGNPDRFDFPRPLCNQKSANMSFSGLKTAVMLKIKELMPLKQNDIENIAASFQQAVCDILGQKTRFAITQYELICPNAKTLVVAGGVAANIKIRETLSILCQNIGYDFIAPPIKLCTDNAAMIAFAGLERVKAGIVNDVGFRPRARWSLEELW